MGAKHQVKCGLRHFEPEDVGKTLLCLGYEALVGLREGQGLGMPRKCWRVQTGCEECEGCEEVVWGVVVGLK